MDLETSLDRMCTGLEELNFRLARIEIALRKQNIRIKMAEPTVVVSEILPENGPEEKGPFCP